MKEMNSYLQEETYGASYEFPPEVIDLYGRAILMVAAGDGEVSDDEWRYFEARGLAMGNSPEQIAKWKAEFREADLEADVKKLAELAGANSYAFLYDGIKVASVDGYSEGERKAVRRAAEYCGISETTVARLENLCEMEEALKKLRTTLLFPSPSVFHDEKSFYNRSLV